MKKLLIAGFLFVTPASAWAVCPNPLTVKDAAGATQNISATNDASGNCQSAIVINLGGVVSGAFASGAFATGSGVDGWDVTEGTKADAAWVSGSGSVIALLKAAVNGINGPIPTNSNVGITQTTPGTTNGVALVGVNGATALAGNGVTGTGSARVTISSDNSPVAGLAAGAIASAPPANAIYNGANGSGATGGQLQGLVVCDKYVFKHITSATDTLAVQGVASQTIRICGFHARAAGVATWFLENTASVNANCSSSNTQISILNTEAANTGITDHSPFWNGLSNTSGNGLCINSTGTGGLDVGIYYAQF